MQATARKRQAGDRFPRLSVPSLGVGEGEHDWHSVLAHRGNQVRSMPEYTFFDMQSVPQPVSDADTQSVKEVLA